MDSIEVISEYVQETVENYPYQEDKTDNPGYNLKSLEGIYPFTIVDGGRD
ncbi:MAG: hypothetical protein PHT99_03090 [Methanoregula sp.]|nr:hypothetical protein [Methanoregula sp.]